MATTTDLILLQYLDILEKTNQQLGLWSNPYGVMVAVLSFLVAVLAIVFGFYLWRQSRDYQKKFDDFLEGLKENFDIEIKENLKFRKEANKKFKKLLSEKKKEIESLTGEAKQKAEEEIREIQELKKNLNRQPLVSLSGTLNVDSSGNLRHVPIANSLGDYAVSLGSKQCKKCKKYYNDSDFLSVPQTITAIGGIGSVSECPYCHNIN